MPSQAALAAALAKDFIFRHSATNIFVIHFIALLQLEPPTLLYPSAQCAPPSRPAMLLEDAVEPTLTPKQASTVVPAPTTLAKNGEPVENIEGAATGADSIPSPKATNLSKVVPLEPPCLWPHKSSLHTPLLVVTGKMRMRTQSTHRLTRPWPMTVALIVTKMTRLNKVVHPAAVKRLSKRLVHSPFAQSTLFCMSTDSQGLKVIPLQHGRRKLQVIPTCLCSSK
ncbi:hypothetical protein VP01_148g12 [Puccinia sorghi]|uniref:Uncharacterized protein n=1 Tax=Puccinia sorghi TaxID=27349 RepID=A0A0L6VL88_9BASI|nr:hypothetical protein VP01_148g12 [Puccinia sorghi]